MLKEKRVFVKTYGCQMNVYDSQKIVDLLRPLGFKQTEHQDDADVVILNTCHIREKAEHKLFSDLGRVINGDPVGSSSFTTPETPVTSSNSKQPIIVVSGCVAQAEGEEIISRAPYVDCVVGPQTYHRLPDMIATILSNRSEGRRLPLVDTEFPVHSKFDFLRVPEQTAVSAFVTIQEGCDKFCTFCCVPYTRGAEYSRPVQEIVDEVKKLIDLGAREVTLLGQNVNAYHGTSTLGQQTALGDLISILASIDGLERIRYTTSHPRDMHQSLIDAHRDIPKLMPFLHLPVQSGSDRILECMNRKHDVDFYIDIIEKIRKARPDIALSSDFIVGFPGESEKEFEETIDLVQRVKFAQAYSFIYSPRPGTPAALMDWGFIPHDVASARLRILQEILRGQQLEFNQNIEGTIQSVLLEKDGKYPGQLIGKTPYMQSVYVFAPEKLRNTFVKAYIETAHLNGLSGVLHS